MVYDDGSHDGTADIVLQLTGGAREVRLVRSNVNRGAGYARRALLHACQGELAAFLDADDYWKPDKLRAQVQEFQNPLVGICATGYSIVDETGAQIGARLPPAIVNFKRMLLSNWIGMSTAVVRLSLKSARDMPDIRHRQDYAYWLRLLRNNPEAIVACIPANHAYYERRAGSLSKSWHGIANLLHNYRVFRNVLGLPRTVSAGLVVCNGVIRTARE
jgi:glycosyltransferase involved in cell wall biosynthesis